MEPIAEGTASVTVTATDLAGESAQSVLTVQVGSVPAGDGGLLIAPNPVGRRSPCTSLLRQASVPKP